LSLIQDLYSRFKHLIHEVGKFGVVGGVGFVIQLGTADVLYKGVHTGELTATVISYVVATAATFVGNKYWTYRHRVGNSQVARESIMFVLLNLVGLLIQLAVVAVVRYGFGLADVFSYDVATVVGVGLGTIFRLFTYRRWVFLATPAAPESVESLEPQLAAPRHGHQPEWGAEGRGGLGNGQVAYGNHAADHVLQPGTGSGRMQNGVVEGRGVHHPGQHRRLND
jgi:putative flippase GtrA